MAMDIDEQSLEEKCESLMNIVVETRKQYGKMCVDYGEKISIVKNKMQKLQIKTFGNHRFKSKHPTSHVNVDEMIKDNDEFREEIVKRHNRIERLRRNVSDIQCVVLQLKEDTIGHKLKRQITAETLLAEAKNRLNKI